MLRICVFPERCRCGDRLATTHDLPLTFARIFPGIGSALRDSWGISGNGGHATQVGFVGYTSSSVPIAPKSVESPRTSESKKREAGIDTHPLMGEPVFKPLKEEVLSMDLKGLTLVGPLETEAGTYLPSSVGWQLFRLQAGS